MKIQIMLQTAPMISLAKLEELIYCWWAGLQAKQVVHLALLLLKVSIAFLKFWKKKIRLDSYASDVIEVNMIYKAI